MRFMPSREHAVSVLLLVFLCCAARGAAAFDPGAVRLSFQPVITGALTQPLLVTHAGDQRLFIVERGGLIRIVRNGALLPTPFLNLVGSVAVGNEQGLLGLAFHPNYAANGRLYVSYTSLSGTSVVSEYQRSATNPDRATGPGRIVLWINQPYQNHNGGHIAFGPDGYLYVGMGDGGSAGDPDERAQNRWSQLGKMLRIDVDGTSPGRNHRIPPDNPYAGGGGEASVWALGLRNPWRWSFDRSTGDLWIGDVGQGEREEIDRALRGAAPAGRGLNFGWPRMEGLSCYRPRPGCNRSGLTMPVTQYVHQHEGLSIGCSVTGGYVYRGAAQPILSGGYIFGDFCSGKVWAIAADAVAPATRALVAQTGYMISSFGEDAAGELYVADYRGGSIYRLIGQPR